jgi:hypothetical protein
VRTYRYLNAYNTACEKECTYDTYIYMYSMYVSYPTLDYLNFLNLCAPESAILLLQKAGDCLFIVNHLVSRFLSSLKE